MFFSFDKKYKYSTIAASAVITSISLIVTPTIVSLRDLFIVSIFTFYRLAIFTILRSYIIFDSNAFAFIQFINLVFLAWHGLRIPHF